MDRRRPAGTIPNSELVPCFEEVAVVFSVVVDDPVFLVFSHFLAHNVVVFPKKVVSLHLKKVILYWDNEEGVCIWRGGCLVGGNAV